MSKNQNPHLQPKPKRAKYAVCIFALALISGLAFVTFRVSEFDSDFEGISLDSGGDGGLEKSALSAGANAVQTLRKPSRKPKPRILHSARLDDSWRTPKSPPGEPLVTANDDDEEPDLVPVPMEDPPPGIYPPLIVRHPRKRPVASASKLEDGFHDRFRYHIWPGWYRAHAASAMFYEKDLDKRPEEMQLQCNEHADCIGFSWNPDWGFQFFEKSSYPLQRKPRWTFWQKIDPGIGQGKGFVPPGIRDLPSFSNMQRTPVDGVKKFNGFVSKSTTVLNRRPDGNFKFITWNWNVGRLNNQLLSFEAAMGYARYYKRVLVIPHPDGKGRGLDNQWLGFRSGVWDMEYLNEYFDYAFAEQLDPDFRWAGQECELPKDIQQGIPDSIHEGCVTIHLMGSHGGIFKFNAAAFGLIKYLRPAKYLREASESLIQEKLDGKVPRIGMHNRMMNEGGVVGGEKFLCRQPRYSAHGPLGGSIRKKLDRFFKTPKPIDQRDQSTKAWQFMQGYFVSCAMDKDDFKIIMELHNQPMPDTTPEKFFLATDNQDEGKIKGLEGIGAVRFKENEFRKYSHDKEHEKYLKTHNCEAINCFNKYYIRVVEWALIDMWTLYQVDFFVGSWASTFTENLCKWRGYERRHNSTLCYLEQRWKAAIDSGTYL